MLYSSDSDDENLDIIAISDMLIKKYPNKKDEKYERFKHLCLNGESKEDIFELVDNYVILWNSFQYMMVKQIYNQYIGWALPSQKVCDIVLETFQSHTQTYPVAKIVDFGSGSGIFAYMFEKIGIPQGKILAIDLPNPTHSNVKQRKFWPIIREKDYEVETDDILFVAWGSNCYNAVNSYEIRGGKCVIILGEVDGCTFCSANFEENDNWLTTLTHVPGPASAYSEHISVNKRI